MGLARLVSAAGGLQVGCKWEGRKVPRAPLPRHVTASPVLRLVPKVEQGLLALHLTSIGAMIAIHTRAASCPDFLAIDVRTPLQVQDQHYFSGYATDGNLYQVVEARWNFMAQAGHEIWNPIAETPVNPGAMQRQPEKYHVCSAERATTEGRISARNPRYGQQPRSHAIGLV